MLAALLVNLLLPFVSRGDWAVTLSSSLFVVVVFVVVFVFVVFVVVVVVVAVAVAVAFVCG